MRQIGKKPVIDDKILFSSVKKLDVIGAQPSWLLGPAEAGKTLPAASSYTEFLQLADSRPVLRMGNAFPTLCPFSPLCHIRLMPGNLPGEITQLLGQWSGGDRAALDELMPLVYEELRRMAHRHMAHERPGHTLQATELVDEVYLKLKDERAARWQNRAQFFAVAAQMMRFILVDYARRHARARRGGGAQKVTLDEAMLVSEDKSSELLLLDEALQKL